MEQPRKAIRIADLDAAHLIGAQVDADISPDLPRRQWLYAWLLNPNIPGNYQKSVDKWIAILIIANLYFIAHYSHHADSAFGSSSLTKFFVMLGFVLVEA